MKTILTSFLCTDEFGNEFTIFEHADFHDIEGRKIPFIREYVTSDGEQCNRLGDSDQFIVFSSKGDILVAVKKPLVT